MNSTDYEDPDVKVICARCVGEKYLKSHIKTSGVQSVCSYCDRRGLAVRIEALAEIIDQAFEAHYVRTDTEPDALEYAMLKDPELDYEWEREGEQAIWAIAEAAEVKEVIAEDIRQILEEKHSDFDTAAMGDECPFAEDSHYEQRSPDNGEFPALWNQFDRNLKTKARFFSRLAHGILDQIFAGIQELRSTNGNPVVVNAGPDTELNQLFRARVFQNEEQKLEESLSYPWLHLGTPPAKSAGAGRMNARGIAVFYGALDADTALQEVRPPVGSKVAIARFSILRTLKLLDLNALQTIAVDGSIFDPATLVAMQKGSFLRILSHTMSRAIMPHEEDSEYLPTQAVADYLANEIRIDGMIFPSVQAGHRAWNVVLFHGAAKVEAPELPPGTKIKSGLYYGDPDDPYLDYWVSEECPKILDTLESNTPAFPFENVLDDFDGEFDERPDTLSIDLQSVEVHHIQAVRFQSVPHHVSRHRSVVATRRTNQLPPKAEDELF